MPNVVFFIFAESDREQVLLIKGRAVNPGYGLLNFRVRDLIRRWDTRDSAVIRRAISTSMKGTSRTIVFVGNSTHLSYWVPEEIRMTLEAGKPVYAMRLRDSHGPSPSILRENGIRVHMWSEQELQMLATY
jgi:hypothetical protein